jgi:hypothetical protein
VHLTGVIGHGTTRYGTCYGTDSLLDRKPQVGETPPSSFVLEKLKTRTKQWTSNFEEFLSERWCVRWKLLAANLIESVFIFPVRESVEES